MVKITNEQIQKFKDLVESVENGKLFRMCNSCGCFYKVTKENFGYVNMCKDCLKGVVIPTF